MTEYKIPRTIRRCKLIRKDGENPRYMVMNDNKCEGYQKSYYDDEPCELCKTCKISQFYKGEHDG